MKTIRFFAAAACMALMASCGGGAKENSAASEKAVDDEAFYATQPVVSGQYRAVSYDIAGGNNPRKGKFDGRLLIKLSHTDPSGMYL